MVAVTILGGQCASLPAEKETSQDRHVLPALVAVTILGGQCASFTAEKEGSQDRHALTARAWWL